MSEVNKIQGDLQFLDAQTYIKKDVSDNLSFTDANAGTKTLTELSQIGALATDFTSGAGWNASTNTPTVLNGTGNAGEFAVVSVTGTTNIDGTDLWTEGDYIWYDANSFMWRKISNAAGSSEAKRAEFVVTSDAEFVNAYTELTTNYEGGVIRLGSSFSLVQNHSFSHENITIECDYNHLLMNGYNITVLGSSCYYNNGFLDSGNAGSKFVFSVSGSVSTNYLFYNCRFYKFLDSGSATVFDMSGVSGGSAHLFLKDSWMSGDVTINSNVARVNVSSVSAYADITITGFRSEDVPTQSRYLGITGTTPSSGVSIIYDGSCNLSNVLTPNRVFNILENNIYSLPVADTGVLGGVLDGTDVSIDSSGNVESASSRVPVRASLLAGSQDLDNYQTAGFYYQSSNANATSGSNYPVDYAGSLFIQKSAGVTQQYHQYNAVGNPELFLRSFYNSSWSPWRKVYHEGNDSDLAKISTTNTFTASNNISVADPIPFTIQRTNADSNVSMAFQGSATTRYLGLGSGGVLKFGSSADLNSSGNTVWHSGNDGPGGGLDADTVDGYEGAGLAGLDYYPYSGGIDPDDSIYTYILSNHANTPNSSYYWHIRTQFYSSISATGNRAQIAIACNSVNQAYIRKCYSNVWDAWQRIDNGDTTLVKTTGDQNIGGVKTFSSSPILNNNRYYGIKSASGATIRTTLLNSSNNVYIGGVDVGVNDTYIRRSGTNVIQMVETAVRLVTDNGRLELMDANTYLREGSTNSIRLGTNSGYIDIGPRNTSWCHFDTDRAANYFYDSLTAPDFKLSSDIYFKKNIEAYDNGLSKVLALKPSYFDWDETKEREGKARSGKDLGMISQWTEEIEPLLVDTEEDGYKSLKYNKISIMNTAAIQEMYYAQKEMNENLLEQISSLEEQFNKLLTIINKEYGIK